MGRVVFAVVLALSLAAGFSGFWISGVQAGGGGDCREPLTEGSRTSVEIAHFCFSPTVLYIEAGSVVKWTNLDSVQHNVVAAGADWSDGRLFSEDETTSARFNQAGIFPYFCRVHPGMVGAVVVGENTEAARLASPGDGAEKNSWLTHGVAILAGSGLSIAAVAGFGARVRRRR